MEELEAKEWRRESEARQAALEAKQLAAKNRVGDEVWKKQVEANDERRFWIGIAITVTVTIIPSFVMSAPTWRNRWEKGQSTEIELFKGGATGDTHAAALGSSSVRMRFSRA